MMYKNDFVVVLKHNGQILREIDNIVSLPFGSEYSIVLKNLNSKRALTSIQVDGKDVLDGKKIIIKGDNELELKGFMNGMNVKNRFKFIQKTKEISDYRGDRVDDGIIRVEFQFEKPKEPDYIIFNGPISYQYNSSMEQDNSAFFCQNNFHNFCDTGFNNFSNSVNIRSTLRKSMNKPLQDEGITVKGSQCNQGFREGSIGELETSSYVITLKLKGITNNHIVYKPITVKTKFVCETCGKVSKSTAKFCARCGTCLT